MNEQQDKSESMNTAGGLLTKERPRQTANPPKAVNRVQSGYGSRRPTTPRPPVKHYEDEEEGFFQRNIVPIAGAVAVLIGAGWLIFGKPMEKSGPVRKAPEQQMVKIVLPPPPPPPPPKIQPPPPKQQKQTEQAPAEKAPDKAPEKPLEKPPEGLGTSIRGSGPGMGLGYGRGTGMIGGTGNGQGGGSAASYYANQVQTKIQQALRNHPKMRSAAIDSLKFTVSLDGSGRITRVELAGSTGDQALDGVIANEILTGLQINDPPGGKPMTITMKLKAQRSGQRAAQQTY